LQDLRDEDLFMGAGRGASVPGKVRSNTDSRIAKLLDIPGIGMPGNMKGVAGNDG